MDALLGYILKCGEANLWAMELLDRANTSRYGQPRPTQVRITPVKGKAILVSGHDLQVSPWPAHCGCLSGWRCAATSDGGPGA
mgnify:FL=1